jgi:uncharacterized membrane protein YdjX (TVP38/TMEM64 family)
MKRGIKLGIGVLSFIIFLVIWTLLLNTFPPKEIIDMIGIKNGYLIAFLIALLGGMTSFTGSSYYLVISTFGAGGLNPFLLGFFGGTGALMSDAIFFFIGIKFGKLISEDKKIKAEKLSKWLRKKPKWILFLGIFLYLGFTPLPNDIITLSLGIMGYRFREILIPIYLGNITSTIIAAYIGSSLIGIIF